MVAGPEVADVRGLEVAHLGAAFALRMAGRRVLARVFPAMVQQQEDAGVKQDHCCRDEKHASGCARLNINRTCSALLDGELRGGGGGGGGHVRGGLPDARATERGQEEPAALELDGGGVTCSEHVLRGGVLYIAAALFYFGDANKRVWALDLKVCVSYITLVVLEYELIYG